jgi:hypothetical protein
MLSELFPKGHRRYEQSPFAADLEQFASWLLALGYSRENTCDRLFRLRTTLERLEGLSPGAIFSEAQLEATFTSPRFPVLYRGTQRAFACFLKQQGRLDLTEWPRPEAVPRIGANQTSGNQRCGRSTPPRRRS